MCVKQTRVLFLSLSGSGGGNLSIYIKGLPAVLEGMGRLVCVTGFTNQCHLCPLINKFFVTFVSGWPGLAYNWCISFWYFCFLEPHCLHKASNHPVISKFMYHFIYSALLLISILILGMLSVCFLCWRVGHLLLLSLLLSLLGRLLLF